MTDDAEAAYHGGLEAEERRDSVAAEGFFGRAVELAPDNAEYLAAAARTARRLGRYNEAENLQKRALAAPGAAHGPDHAEVGSALFVLADIHAIQGREDDVLALYERGLETFENALSPDHPKVADILEKLADFPGNRRKEETEALWRRCLEIREKAFGPDDPNLSEILPPLTTFCNRKGRVEEALALYGRRVAIEEKNSSSPDGRKLNDALVSLGQYCWQLGCHEAVARTYANLH